MSVINSANNQIIATIAAGSHPVSTGNFVKSSVSCSGPPVTFTITVTPTLTIPAITTTAPTGTISACLGTPSADPNIQQFNASGTNLTGDITVTAPAGFEVSREIDGPYSSNPLTLTQTLGIVSSSLIYIRSGATAPAGNISNENVKLSSPGAMDQSVSLSGVIYSIPAANTPSMQRVVNGTLTTPVNFTGTASSYAWVNNTTSIGLAANGTGNISSFTAVNNTGSPIIALITVTPLNGLDCAGQSQEFTITVDPSPTVLTVTGTLTALTTVYGTPSPSESFTVSCTTIGSKILVTPPAGFEVSSDGIAFSNSVTITTEVSNSPIPVYIRLASSTQVGNNYGGNLIISTANANSQKITMPLSSVTPAPLTITADNKTRPFGAANPALTVSYSGFVNNDEPAQLTIQPAISTTATSSSTAGQYPIIANGAVSPEYTFTYIPGILTITPYLSLQDIPNTFTPNGDGRNDTWVIKGLEYYPQSTVNIFNRWGQKLYSSVGYPIPWDGEYNGKALPSGTYYYIIDLKNRQPVIAGWVAIIR
jgi:gliding motility-associated-like protein